MSTVFIIACSARKSRLLESGSRLPAREAYMGQAFRFSREAVERRGAPYFILSAHYGLLAPDSIIENYNVKMTPLNPEDQWDTCFDNVTDDQLHQLRTADRVVVLGSRLYADAAGVLLGRPVEAPLAGLPIGRMLNALRVGMWDSLPNQWKEAA
jgi:hypothetical protein